jgi:hypothetical protein
VAVQFSLSYDANGDPVLVENTVSGTRKVVSTSSVVSPYKSRFESPASGDPVTDAEENQPDNNQSAIMDYIMEMEKGADNDPNLSFIQKQNLERYTPDSIEARSKEKTPTQKVIETVMRAVIPYADAATAAVKALEAILPEESEEIKAIKQFYADPEQAALVESIPGMSNYNLVYGNPFDPSYGLANAAQKRIDRINKTLMKKDSSVLRDRRDKLQELIDKENKQKSDFNVKKSQSLITNQESQETAAYDSPRDRDPPSAPQKATETASYSNQSAYEEASGQGGYSGGYDSSTGNYNDPYSDDTE